MKRAVRLVASLVIALAANGAQAADQIRMLIGAPPGGGTDVLFRSLAKQAGESLGATVVPANLPAAAGSTVLDQVLRSPANGTTLGALANSTLTTAPHLMKVAFDQSDYLPILQVSEAAYTMCVSTSFAALTADEVIATLKAQPGRYTIGTDPGIGQLMASRILQALGLDVRIVPFKGASEIVVAFLGGHVDMYQGSLPVVLPHVASGKARCFLVTGAERSARLPGAASLRDLGIAAEATLLTRIFVVRKDTPAPIVERLVAAFETAAHSPETRQLLDAAGDRFVVVKGEALRRNVAAEFDALGAVARKLGIVP